ncbi:MAG TPA: DUF6531 domain-containing protein, partial [Acidimicrobiales bacterium]|nr:DUF6531 domain-containing protein [Acidimicrobiales bacterium]
MSDTDEVLSTLNGGVSWTPQTVPIATGDGLSAVACPSTSVCYAIVESTTNNGESLPSDSVVVQTTDGGATWSADDLASGSYPSEGFNAIACPSTQVCVAVGPSPADNNVEAVYTANGGGTWNDADISTACDGSNCISFNTAQGDGVFAISCPSTSQCFVAAEGQYGGYPAAAVLSTVQSGSTALGESWTAVMISSGGSGTNYDEALGISCSSTASCFAVGSYGYYSGGTNYEVAKVWKLASGSWSSVIAPSGPTELSEVTCTSSSDCYAIAGGWPAWLGYYEGDVSDLYLTVNAGSTWSSTTGSSGSSLDSVACPSTSSCFVAGGDYSYGAFVDPMSSGGVLSAGSLPNYVWDLDAISCATATSCVASGSTPAAGVVASSDGGATWFAPPPSSIDASWESTYSSLDAISCPAAGNCYAAAQNGTLYASSNDGLSWTEQSLPTGAQAIRGVSCPSTDLCYAIGSGGAVYANADGGADWSTVTAGPSGLSELHINALQCLSSSECFAVGSDSSGAVIAGTTDSFGAWSVPSLPTSVSNLLSIDCPASSTCYAGGSATSGSGAVVSTTNLTSWTAASLSGSSWLNAVACSSTTSCEGVGQEDSSGVLSAVAYATSDGSSWSSMDLPVALSDLSGATCTSVSCFAVGEEDSSGLGAVILSLGLVVTPPSSGGGDGGVDPGASNVVASARAGVNTENGDFTTSSTDFDIPSYGEPLTFTRTYDSFAAQVEAKYDEPGPLGYGWTDNWATALLPAPGGSTLSPSAPVVLDEPGGGEQVYDVPIDGACPSGEEEPSGASFCAPTNVLASLSYDSATSTYVLTEVGGSTETFSSSGALTSIADPEGDTTTIASTSAPSSDCTSEIGSPPTASGEKITSPSGRSLAIGFSSAGFITSVSDPLGRTWCYDVNSSEDLAAVADPMGYETTYEYATTTSFPNDLATITDPNQQGGDVASLTNTYNSSGQLVEQEDALGRITSYSYNPDGTVTVEDPNENGTSSGSSYDYSGGQLAAEISGTGAPTSYSYDPITELTTSELDADGGVTRAAYDSQGDVTSSTNPNGNTSTSAFSTTGYLDLQTCTSDPLYANTCTGTDSGPALLSPGSELTPPVAPPEGLTYYQYDTSGNLLW